MCEIRGTEVNKRITASKVYLLTNIGERGFICACGRMGGLQGWAKSDEGSSTRTAVFNCKFYNMSEGYGRLLVRE